jgi:hypothetical protein
MCSDLLVLCSLVDYYFWFAVPIWKSSSITLHSDDVMHLNPFAAGRILPMIYQPKESSSGIPISPHLPQRWSTRFRLHAP